MVNPVLTATHRNNVIDNIHRGAFALVVDGELKRHAGDVERSIYPRSSLKLLQALACVASGAVERFGLSRSELAVICGSHWAEERHIEAVRSILGKAKVPESALGCGWHPLEDREREIDLARRGIKLSAVYHNCSGKHAGMLAAAAAMGAPLDSYLDPSHPVQRKILDIVSTLSGCPTDKIGTGIDGCTAPILRLPLAAMAMAFARISTPAAIKQPELRSGAERVLEACLEFPEMVAGKKSFCTALMQAGDGMIFSKGGAEGYYAFGIVGKNTGFAMKIDDGDPRHNYRSFVIGAARSLGGIAQGGEKQIAPYDPILIKTWTGVVVGRVKPATIEDF